MALPLLCLRETREVKQAGNDHPDECQETNDDQPFGVACVSEEASAHEAINEYQ